MGDRLISMYNQANLPSRSSIHPESLNRVPALVGCGKGRNVISARWQVTLCDPIWHVSFHSGEASCITAIRVYHSDLCDLHKSSEEVQTSGYIPLPPIPITVV